VKPFYFGDSARPLFGVYHAASTPGRRPGVVICPPFGQESLRAHRSLRELAGRLADAGMPALRFDYHGSGDSAGEPEEARLAEWVADAAAAVEELRETTGERRVALVGLRLGAAVAALAAGGLGEVAALVLWEPATDGSSHLAELRAAHTAWLHDHAPGASLVPDEVLGFTLSAPFATELNELRLERLARVPARRVLLAASGEVGRGLWHGQAGVERRVTAAAPVWLHAEGMSRVLVPSPLLDDFTTWLREALA
jgi:alpha/beta superfamily hydrolase